MKTTGEDTIAGQHDASADGAFAPIELPPVPTFGRPRAYDPMEQLRDEPPATWQSPFPDPAQPRPYTYRVAPPPMAAMPVESERAAYAQVTAHAVAPVVLPTAAPAPAIAPTNAAAPSRVPAMAPVASPVVEVDETAPDAVGMPSRVAVVLLAVLAVLLYWAAGMAFSAALHSMSALVLVELARAIGVSRADGTPMSSKVVAVVAALLGILSVLGAVGAMTGEGFVAGLFVLVALAPLLLVVGGVALVQRLRTQPTSGDLELRGGIRRLLVAAVLIGVAGYHANKTFAPTVDSLVAIVIGAFVVVSAVRVLRGSRAV